MSWFTLKLEPGETVVLRKTGGRQILWLVALLLFVFLPVEFGLLLTDEAPGISLGRLLLLAPLAAASLLVVVLPLLLGESGWKLAITTRRLIHRSARWGTTAAEIPINEIGSVRHDFAANCIVVRGGLLEISLDPDLVQIDELEQAIARAKEDAQ